MKALKNNMQKRNGQRSKIQCPFILHYFGFEVTFLKLINNEVINFLH